MNQPQATKHIELAGTVTVGSKGQVVIPVEVREKMSICPGSKLIALYLPHKNAIGFVSEESMQAIIESMGRSLEDLSRTVGKQ